MAAVFAGLGGDGAGPWSRGLFSGDDVLALVGGAAMEAAQEKQDVRMWNGL
ncbi:hypothetical protein D3C80_2137490 [compost metagenome]